VSFQLDICQQLAAASSSIFTYSMGLAKPSEVDRMAKPEKERNGQNVQYPPVPRKPRELIHS
jgi:hypothetical protein